MQLNSRFGGGIDGEERIRWYHGRTAGADIDDGASPPLEHPPQHGSRDLRQRDEVHLHHLHVQLHLILVEVERVRVRNASVVHEHAHVHPLDGLG